MRPCIHNLYDEKPHERLRFAKKFTVAKKNVGRALARDQGDEADAAAALGAGEGAFLVALAGQLVGAVHGLGGGADSADKALSGQSRLPCTSGSVSGAMKDQRAGALCDSIRVRSTWARASFVGG